MKMQELREKAKKLGIVSFGKTRENLMREIAIAEGGDACFGSALEVCSQWGCRVVPLCFDEASRFVEKPAAAATTAVKKKKIVKGKKR
jgi:hypothetical protein